MSVDEVSWVAIAGEIGALTVQAYGPFPTLESAMHWINAMPNGWTGNIYQLNTPLGTALNSRQATASVERLVRAFDHYLRPDDYDEQDAWLELKAAMYHAGWREDGG
jgi:hypothetical protein